MSEFSLQEIERRRGAICSSKGGWIKGRGVTNHGYSQLDDLLGKASFVQVLVLNVTGQLPDLRFSQWLEGTFVCCSWPDPRVWCNQIGALGGDARVSGVSAVCAGTLASESTVYGPGTIAATSALLQRGLDALREGIDVADFIESWGRINGRSIIPGFCHPIVINDHKVTALKQLADALGFEPGPYQELAFAMHDYLQLKRSDQSNYGEALNMGGYVVAFMLDQAYAAADIERLLTLLVSGGVHASYSEYRDLPVDSFLPLRCDDIEYTGVSERSVPEN
jgi:citrate synthase